VGGDRGWDAGYSLFLAASLGVVEGASVSAREKPAPTPWPPALPPGTLVWCSSCAAKHPGLIVDNDATSVDLLCGHCRLVLLTMFRVECPGDQTEAL
jgi:hypothetical protein